LNIVKDLGEDVFPEPQEKSTAGVAAPSSSQEETSTVDSHEPPANTAVETPGSNSADGDKSEKVVTTEERKPIKVPDSVHVRIVPENLKDYVGPPIYYKDRMFGFAPPPGVSSGLGYLGNGSGALMPIEATVSQAILLSSS
jgi:Lon-like ATP-dependent protease